MAGLYAIRIKGRLGATALSAFPSMAYELKGSETVLTGWLEDRSALYGVLAQIEGLGLELLEVRQVRGVHNRMNRATTATRATTTRRRRMRTPMANPVRIFAVTGDAVARFRLDDPKPEFALEGYQVRCIAIDPRDPERVYVGTMDNGLWFSTDGGASWREAGPSIDEPRVLSVAVSRSHERSGVSVVYAGTEPSNLYRSEDGGFSWQQLPALRELPSASSWSFPPRPWTHHVRTIALHPTDPESLAVGIELGGVMRSRDRGKTWIDHNRQAHSDAHQLLTHPLAPERVYEAAGQGIARSDDRGDTWKRLDAGLDRHYAWAEAIDPADPDLWYVSVSRGPFAAHGGGDGQARLLRSRGKGWEAVDGWGDSAELRRMPYALVTLPDQPGRLLVGLRGGTLLITDDAGETWSRLAVRLPDVIELAAAPA